MPLGDVDDSLVFHQLYGTGTEAGIRLEHYSGIVTILAHILYLENKITGTSTYVSLRGYKSLMSSYI